MTDTANLVTPAALAGIEPLAAAVADTADGVFTTRIYPGLPSKVATNIVVVTNVDSEGHGEPYSTSLEEGETAQQRADAQAAGWIRSRGPAVSEHARVASGQGRADLLARASDRPAHKRLIETLLHAADRVTGYTPAALSLRWDEINAAAEGTHRGVGEKLADAIMDDVVWLTVTVFRPERNQPHPRAYSTHRARTARQGRNAQRRTAQASAQHATAGPRAVADALSFLNR